LNSSDGAPPLRIRVGHVEAQVHDHFLGRRVNAVRVEYIVFKSRSFQEHLNVLLFGARPTR
jgi:hypothetical protein